MVLDLNRDCEYNVQKDPIYPCGRWDFFISLLGGTFAVALTYIRGMCRRSPWQMSWKSMAYVADIRDKCRASPCQLIGWGHAGCNFFFFIICFQHCG